MEQPDGAKSTGAGGPGTSTFYGITADSSGNVYTSGSISGTSSFDFGDSVTVSGGNSGSNALVVSYTSSGTARWAKSTAAGAPNTSEFLYQIAVDSSSNVFVVGRKIGNGTFDYGDGITVTGGYSSSNAVLVSYSSTGTTRWAKTVGAGAPNQSFFYGVGVDSSGNVYVSGEINSTSSYDFGNSVTVAGGNSGGNAVTVKYNSSGVAQWARSTGAGAPDYSSFFGTAVDNSGNIYSAGEIDNVGGGAFDFGDGVTVTPGNATGSNVVVSYSSSGVAQWAKSTEAGAPDYSVFNGVATATSGEVYAAGYIETTSSYDFGNSVTVAGGNSVTNAVIVSYTGEPYTENNSDPAPVASSPLAGASNTASPPVCGDEAPSGEVNLYQIDAAGTYVNLYFSTITGGTGYSINYGLTPDANQYGDNFEYSGNLWNIGRTISGLQPNTTYYFKVRAVNGCNAGVWRAVKSVKTKGLFANVTQWFANLRPLNSGSVIVSLKSSGPAVAGVSKTPGSCSYIVQEGDSFWKIASEQFGSGARFGDLEDLNPGVSVLQIGQTISVCK